MREWILSSNVNDRWPDSRHRSTNRSPQSAALDLPPRRIGLYSARAAPQLRDSLPRSMDVLTIVSSARKQELWLYYALMATIGSVSGGYVTYRLARKGGKKPSNASSRPGRSRRFIGYFGRWGFGPIAIAALLPTAGAHGSISLCCRRNAIFRRKIPHGAGGRAGCLIFLPGDFGGPLWTESAHGHVATWTSDPHRPYSADCSGNRGSPYRSGKETQ